MPKPLVDPTALFRSNLTLRLLRTLAKPGSASPVHITPVVRVSFVNLNLAPKDHSMKSNNKHARKVISLVALLLFNFTLANSAESAGQYPPIKYDDYQTFLQRLALQAGNDQSRLAAVLKDFGFTCRLASTQRSFQCVRFACGRDLSAGSGLLQWTVSGSVDRNLKPYFDGGAAGYGIWKACFRKDRVVEEQKSFIEKIK
jgi:hypothetical protein